MRSIKLALMACAAVALAGCYTYRDSQGRPAEEPVVYRGGESSDGLMAGLSRGVKTNYFGPIYYRTDAAWGVGTPSGGMDHTLP